MSRAEAHAAIDGAFAAAVGRLFATLAASLIDRTDDVEAQRKFAAGLDIQRRAHALAAAEIDRLFTE